MLLKVLTTTKNLEFELFIGGVGDENYISQLKKNKIIFFVSHNLDIMHNLDYIFEVKEGYLKEISKS